MQPTSKLRPALRWLPTLFFLVAIFWLSATPGDEVARISNPLYKHAPSIQLVKPVKIPWLKIGHVLGYSGLGISLFYGFRARTRRAAVFAVLVTLLYALTDEFHQTFTPGRHAGLNDVALDVGAAGVAILVYTLMRTIWLRQLRSD